MGSIYTPSEETERPPRIVLGRAVSCQSSYSGLLDWDGTVGNMFCKKQSTDCNTFTMKRKKARSNSGPNYSLWKIY